ncbi:MAG: Uma2 family endonuclease [Thermoleophilaceae bacterium]
MQVAERMTAQEFLALPEPASGRPRLSLVEGELVVNEPTPLHSFVDDDLAFALSVWARAKPGRGRVLRPIDVLLDERNVFGPDILWYSEGRAPARHGQPPSPMPDLVVEIRSPSTWRYDIGAKKAAYERHGLPELWLVDTAAEAVLVFRRSQPRALSFDVVLELGRNGMLESPLLVGFALGVGALFPAG